MPSHGATHTMNAVETSKGERLSPVMWRANRLADFLAKSAAAKHRLPAWIARKVTHMGQLVVHHAARLGVATKRANGHRMTVRNEDGIEHVCVMRDSNAKRPDWKLRPRKRRQAGAQDELPGGQATSSPLLRLQPVRSIAVQPPCALSCKSKRSLPPQPSTTKRAKQRSIVALRQDVHDEARLAKWIAAYDARPAHGSSAEERIAALRARIREKERQRAEQQAELERLTME